MDVLGVDKNAQAISSEPFRLWSEFKKSSSHLDGYHSGTFRLAEQLFLPELANFFLSLIFGIIKRSLPCPCQLWHKISLSTFLPIKNLKNSMNDERNWSNTMRMEELSGSVLLILEFFLTSSWIVWICLRLFKILFIIVITILISQIIFVLFSVLLIVLNQKPPFSPPKKAKTRHHFFSPKKWPPMPFLLHFYVTIFPIPTQNCKNIFNSNTFPRFFFQIA